MGTKQKRVGRARVAFGAAVAAAVVTAPLLAIAPAGASTGPSGRTMPPRDTLHAAAVHATATGSSPYNITNRLCGDTRPAGVPAAYSTLYAYGADGGDTAQGNKGGGGAVAVASFALPVGTVLNGAAGCKGTSATAGNHDSNPGGKGHGNATGGTGGAGTGGVDGYSGAGGGGYSSWYRGTTPLVEAGAGGGAGGSSGGGAGGDAGSPGGDGRPGTGPCCPTGGGAGTFDAPGAPGSMNGGYGGGPYSGGPGGYGGGGGGSGIQGGGGGGGGFAEAVGPGAGGGGGGSNVYTAAGYWLDFGGAGHGSHLDGLIQIVTVRPLTRRPSFPGRNVVRGIAPNGTRGGGYEVLGNGDIRTFAQGANPSAATGALWWPGQDVAHGIAVLPDRSGGYVVDEHGQLHAFGIGSHTPPKVTDRVLWPDKDIARGVTVLADGTGGYVLGRDGRLYSFAIGKHAKPADAQRVPTWPGQDVARGITAPFLDANGVAGGWIVDPFGGLHPWGGLFGGPTPKAVAPTSGARGVLSFGGGAGGLLVDGAGNLSPFASPGLP